jgi:uncharacterized protein (TIGR03067 family)
MFAKASLASAVAALVLTFGLASAAPAAAHPDEARLQGTWKLVAIGDDKKPAPGAANPKFLKLQGALKVVIKGRSFQFHMGPDKAKDVLPGTYSLNRDGIDFWFNEEAQVVCPAIYRLEGDRLTVCWAWNDGIFLPRPGDLTPGPNRMVLVFQRDKR